MDGGIFAELKRACAEEWKAYAHHDFVHALGAGTLPEASFRHYLEQDYLFLIHFSRAYALAIAKADNLHDMRKAKAALDVILDTEMELHVGYCARWGIARGELETIPEATATVAYTRYVLDRGLSGGLLDLHVALAPCVIGYAEIGKWLAGEPWVVRGDENPYEDWIAMYSSADFQSVASDSIAYLDELAGSSLPEKRMDELTATFRTATRMEAAFWQMGLDRSL